jgi:hypothetical protein
VDGQNWFPLTPTPLQVPPDGVPDNVTHGAFTQRLIGAIVGIIFNTKTSISTGGLTHPKELVAKTETAFVINPGVAVPQLTVIALVPCPFVIIPGEDTDHVYVSPGTLAT